MKNTFLMQVKAYRRVIVEAPNAEAALEAMADFNFSDWEHDETKVERALPDQLSVESAIRHGAVRLYL